MNDPDELDPKTLDLTSDTRCIEAVSYTHLDVYKRQHLPRLARRIGT